MSDQVEPLEPHLDLAPTSWPKVVGIISMVWGGIGLTCTACGMGFLLFGLQMMPPEIRDNPPPSMKFGAMQGIQMLSGVALGVLLIFAGALTLRRSMAGRTLHLTWGVLSLLSVAFGGYMAWHQQHEMEVWMRDNPDSPIAKQQQGGGAAVGMAATAFFLLLFSAWPIFCLIWFGLVKRTQASFGAAPVKDYI